MSYSHMVDNEVSPLTIEVPKIVQDIPSGLDRTQVTSSEPMEQLSDGQRDPPTHFGKPESQKPNFDFNGPYPSRTATLPGIPVPASRGTSTAGTTVPGNGQGPGCGCGA